MNILDIYKKCSLCPRNCKADRTVSAGFCGETSRLYAAKAYLHKWEEPCISYKNGAGTIFFSGCSLHCVYCQNNRISNELFGKELTVSELSDIILSLQDRGADNIEFVTPTHFVPHIIAALDIVKPELNIPVIYNSGGYENLHTLRLLKGYIDIYMPDLKYFSSDISLRYSAAEDYFEKASAAVSEMISQTGSLQYNTGGGLIKGTIIRHLILPGCRHDSMRILDWIAENTSPDNVLVSIMNQYTPFDFIPDDLPELKRRLTKMEYNSVARYAAELGISGFTQGRSAVGKDFVPDFDLSF